MPSWPTGYKKGAKPFGGAGLSNSPPKGAPVPAPQPGSAVVVPGQGVLVHPSDAPMVEELVRIRFGPPVVRPRLPEPRLWPADIPSLLPRTGSAQLFEWGVNQYLDALGLASMANWQKIVDCGRGGSGSKYMVDGFPSFLSCGDAITDGVFAAAEWYPPLPGDLPAYAELLHTFIGTGTATQRMRDTWYRPYEEAPFYRPVRNPEPEKAPDVRPGRAVRPRPHEQPVKVPDISPVPVVMVPPLPNVPFPVVSIPPFVEVPGVGLVPVQAPDIVIQPGHPAVPIAPSNPSTPPGKGEKEPGKPKIAGPLVIAVNVIGEGVELIDALWDTLPDDLRSDCKDDIHCKLADLYDFADELDPAAAIAAYINEQIEDTAAGLQGRAGGRATAGLGITFGLNTALGGGWGNDNLGGLAGSPFPIPQLTEEEDGSWSISIPGVGSASYDDLDGQGDVNDPLAIVDAI